MFLILAYLPICKGHKCPSVYTSLNGTEAVTVTDKCESTKIKDNVTWSACGIACLKSKCSMFALNRNTCWVCRVLKKKRMQGGSIGGVKDASEVNFYIKKGKQ